MKNLAKLTLSKNRNFSILREEVQDIFRILRESRQNCLRLKDFGHQDSNEMKQRKPPKTKSQVSPLIDIDWLLGTTPPGRLENGPLKRDRLQQLRRRFFPLFALCSVCVSLIALGPTVSKWWLRVQLLDQFHDAESPADQELAIVSLAEMLPESTPQLVTALGCVDPIASKLAYDALELYIKTLSNLDESKKSRGYAYVLHAIDQTIPYLNDSQKTSAVALVSSIESLLQKRDFSGSRILLTTCKTILDSTRSGLKANIVASSKTEEFSLDNQVAPVQSVRTPVLVEPPIAAKIRFRDEVTDHNRSGATVVIDRPKQAIMPEPAEIHPSLSHAESTPLFRTEIPAIPSRQNIEPTSIANQNVAPSESLPARSPESGSDRDVAFSEPSTQIPVFKSPKTFPSSGARISTASLINSQNVFDSNESVSSSSTEPQLQSEAEATASDSGNEVVGIDRQKTEDLVALLGSVRTRVASAALYELERRGMSPSQLEIAVDLARGGSESRILALDRLVQQSDFDPTPWLGWLAADRDRVVRIRAISLLGSLNSQSARTKLRLLLTRERDEEISRNIQQILLSSAKVQSSSVRGR